MKKITKYFVIFSIFFITNSQQIFGYVPFFNLLANLVEFEKTAPDLTPHDLEKKLIAFKDQLKILKQSPNKLDPTPKEALLLLKNIKIRMKKFAQKNITMFEPIEIVLITNLSSLTNENDRIQKYYEKKLEQAKNHENSDNPLIKYLASRVVLWCAERLKTYFDDKTNQKYLPRNTFYNGD
ncbi:MAG: hypothetical protein ABH827_05275 [bacterium]